MFDIDYVETQGLRLYRLSRSLEVVETILAIHRFLKSVKESEVANDESRRENYVGIVR